LEKFDLPANNQKISLFALPFWWLKIVLMGLLSLFFLLYGIETLIGAYSLKNPMEFIVYFFSASFMILVSSVGAIFSFFKIYGHLKARGEKDDSGGAT